MSIVNKGDESAGAGAVVSLQTTGGSGSWCSSASLTGTLSQDRRYCPRVWIQQLHLQHSFSPKCVRDLCLHGQQRQTVGGKKAQ